MEFTLADYDQLRRPGRKVQGVSAILLPYDPQGRMDEAGFRAHLRRTRAAGIRCAVNMDTGYGDLLTPEEKQRVLGWTQEEHAGQDWYAAGALPAVIEGSPAAAYAAECARIAEAGGIPMIFPSPATKALDDEGLIAFFREISQSTPRFLAFELGTMFNPNGRMFSLRVLHALMEMPQCLGLKHSSLDRRTELVRLVLRDKARAGFIIYTGNDVALDMIEFGSDYLLGLSTFAPEAFAARDRAWLLGAADYVELRDAIQYLGWIGFRSPVPAYKHSAAIFLKMTGGLEWDETHPRAPRRQPWDREALADAARRLLRVCPEAGRLPESALELQPTRNG